MESIKSHLSERVLKGQKEQYQVLKEQTLQDKDVQLFLKCHTEISEEMVQNSLSKLYEFVQEKKRMQEKGHSQNPGFSPKLVMNVGFIDVVYQATPDYLVQEEQREIAQRIQTLDMPKGISKLRLKSDYIDDEAGRKEAVRYLVQFAKAYQGNVTMPLKGAYIYGSYGVGKTHMLGCLAGELASKGYASYLAHFPSLVVELKESIATNSVHEKLDMIKKAPLLMLDDIGGEALTQWVRDDVLMIILDYRMRQNLPTFFTSNLDFVALEDHFKGTTIEDERKAKRLMERMHVLAHPIQVTGANKRHV